MLNSEQRIEWARFLYSYILLNYYRLLNSSICENFNK
jgi:hypothetical protein